MPPLDRRPRPPGASGAQQLPKGRHGLSRAFIASNQRERLLDAIANVVAEKGYAGTRVADITDYAGVSRKTFYELFTDKEECFLAAFDAITKLLMDRMAQALTDLSDSNWRIRVRALLGEFLRFLAAEPAFARMCIVEVLGSGPRGPGPPRRRDRGVLPRRRLHPPLAARLGAVARAADAGVRHRRDPRGHLRGDPPRRHRDAARARGRPDAAGVPRLPRGS